ncbi:hypothetical protein RASY3_14155 [Ruminococcus albus SY3]|uniref:Uncharacterized protein n=1 Tax=Ruminococcus albus SY3 TaxID=1341156 RepID=A0A011UCY9_RUMAL|nr:hypothetical protein [Ruminococcus albus]EXM38479.1 hypothetical protein RASY3_14155 [Ruminococcus albus SY3]
MSIYKYDSTQDKLIPLAGQGKAEYGASTVRKGTVGVPAIAANADYVDQTITFSTPMPDTDYLVDLSLQGSNTHRVAFHVVANTKTVNGFTVRFTPIGVKQTTEVGVSGITNNLSYMLTVQRDDVYPNLTKNTALIDPAVSLPTEWNPMQTGYLRNPMPANESTLVYTAFKLYTDTEYNNLLDNAVLTSDVTDSVTNGDLSPVTSNAVAEALAVVDSPITKVGTAINGDRFWSKRTGNVVEIMIDGTTGSNIPCAQSVVVAKVPKNALTISDVCIEIDSKSLVSAPESGHKRAWVDSTGNVCVFIVMPDLAATYTGNIYIGGTYITAE